MKQHYLVARQKINRLLVRRPLPADVLRLNESSRHSSAYRLSLRHSVFRLPLVLRDLIFVAGSGRSFAGDGGDASSASMTYFLTFFSKCVSPPFKYGAEKRTEEGKNNLLPEASICVSSKFGVTAGAPPSLWRRGRLRSPQPSSAVSPPPLETETRAPAAWIRRRRSTSRAPCSATAFETSRLKTGLVTFGLLHARMAIAGNNPCSATFSR